MIEQTSLHGLRALTRRRAIVCIVASGMQPFAATPTSAAPLLIEPVLRDAQPVRIALPDFLASSTGKADRAQPVSQIITANLKRSEQFALMIKQHSSRSHKFLLATSHLRSSKAQSEKYAGGGTAAVADRPEGSAPE